MLHSKTLLSPNSYTPNLSIVKKCCLDAEIVTNNELLPIDHWATTDDRNDEEIKFCKSKLIKEANARYNENPERGSPYLYHSDKNNPIPSTDESARLAIALMVDPKKQAKKHLDGISDLLGPRTVIETMR